MNFINALWHIFLDSLERLHRLHLWMLFVLLGLCLGAMAGVLLFPRVTGMLSGAALGVWAAVLLGKRFID